MTLDDEIEVLQNKLNLLREKEAELVSQIAVAKDRARESGHFSSSVWFRRVNLALMKTRADIDQHQRAIKLLYRRWAYMQQQGLESIFLVVAQDRLKPAEFAVLLDAARDVMK